MSACAFCGHKSSDPQVSRYHLKTCSHAAPHRARVAAAGYDPLLEPGHPQSSSEPRQEGDFSSVTYGPATVGPQRFASVVHTQTRSDACLLCSVAKEPLYSLEFYVIPVLSEDRKQWKEGDLLKTETRTAYDLQHIRFVACRICKDCNGDREKMRDAMWEWALRGAALGAAIAGLAWLGIFDVFVLAGVRLSWPSALGLVALCATISAPLGWPTYKKDFPAFHSAPAILGRLGMSTSGFVTVAGDHLSRFFYRLTPPLPPGLR